MNRARILERAHANGRTGANPSPNVNVNPARRVETVVHPSGPGIRKGKTRYAGSGDKGYRSAWAASPYFFTDPAWSQTVSTVERG